MIGRPLVDLVVLSGLRQPLPTPHRVPAAVQHVASRTCAHALQSATLFGTAYVFLGPATHVAKVKFYVDDINRRHSPKRTDTPHPSTCSAAPGPRPTPWWTTALKEGTHHLTAAVTTTSGRTTVVQAVFTVRNTPRPPVSPRAVAGDNKVSIFWHSAGGPTRGFNVYRSTSTPVPLTKPLNGATPLRASAVSFVDRTAHNATTYRYVVVAVGVHALHSKPTSTLTARPLPTAPTPPPAPKDIDASADAGQISVTWTSGGGTTSGFNVYRSTSPSVPLTNPVNGSLLPAGPRASLTRSPSRAPTSTSCRPSPRRQQEQPVRSRHKPPSAPRTSRSPRSTRSSTPRATARRPGRFRSRTSGMRR